MTERVSNFTFTHTPHLSCPCPRLCEGLRPTCRQQHVPATSSGGVHIAASSRAWTSVPPFLKFVFIIMRWCATTAQSRVHMRDDRRALDHRLQATLAVDKWQLLWHVVARGFASIRTLPAVQL